MIIVECLVVKFSFLPVQSIRAFQILNKKGLALQARPFNEFAEAITERAWLLPPESLS